MRIRRKLVTKTMALLTVPLAVAAAGMSAASAAPGARAAHAATASHAASATSAPVVVTTTHSKFGRVLVTGSGMSLYVFSGDDLPFSTSGPQLDCTALNKAPNGLPCTTAWPPLLATGPLVAKNGVQQNHLGTVTRNGVTQVTYFGHPLYGFIKDTAPGQMNGEDVAAFNGMWYLQKTDGRPAVGEPTVQAEVSSLGVILASPTASGVRTLYLLTADTRKMTGCTTAGGCTAFWPPLLTRDDAMTGPGVDRDGIGTILRPDGTHQVTFHGHPLYFFAFDLGAGAPAGLTNGEYILDPAPVNGVWYSVLPNGTPNPGTTTVGSESTSGGNILSITAGLTKVTATLYAFSADTATMSNCTGKCAMIWPPVITATPPAATGGANASLLGVIPRADGTFQVTYNGHPLYFFADGLNSGTSGAGIKAFGGTFNTVTTAGNVG